MEDRKKKKKGIVYIIIRRAFDTALQLKPLFDEYDYHIITEKSIITEDLSQQYHMSFLTYGARNYLFRYVFKFSYNIFKSFYYFLREKPDVIVTTGAHTAVPICYIAKLFRKKVIFIESFAKTSTPTISGKLVYPIADLFIVQWEEMKRHYPKAIHGGSIY